MGKSVSVGDGDTLPHTVLTRAGGRVEVVASLSQSRTAAAQCGLFTYKSVPVMFEPPCSSEVPGQFVRKTANSQQNLQSLLSYFADLLLLVYKYYFVKNFLVEYTFDLRIACQI